jgi:hypothetical protein
MWVQEQRLNLHSGGQWGHQNCLHQRREWQELAPWAVCSIVEQPIVLRATHLWDAWCVEGEWGQVQEEKLKVLVKETKE